VALGYPSRLREKIGSFSAQEERETSLDRNFTGLRNKGDIKIQKEANIIKTTPKPPKIHKNK